jgi:hypothetical protein
MLKFHLRFCKQYKKNLREVILEYKRCDFYRIDENNIWFQKSQQIEQKEIDMKTLD